MTPDARQAATYELPRGSTVGKYEILRRLAVGGMAEIYLARVRGQAGFEKLCVLKRILPNVAEDPSFVQMFLEEARLAATLRHANIADVYDVGEAEGTYFFTMEYVYGQDARVLRHETNKRAEQIPLAISLALIHGAASALEHAHEKKGPDGKLLGLVHRDVSASNVMVSYDGAVKLLDFGIARASTSSHKTQTGTLKGKIPYMSPEQCKGWPLDRRSDLFSLGVVLYEVTVGRRPFRGESDFAIMDQIVYKGAVPPTQMVRGYPVELEEIVMKLLDRDPKLRYPTAGDMLHDLDEFIARHGLWLSPRAIGKYMRTLFADRIQAWEQAEQEGRSFTQHVVESVTSQSQRSELVTPPTDFPGLPPATPSQELRAQQRPPDPPPEPIGTMAPLPVLRPALPTPPAHMAPHIPSEPLSQIDLRPKSSRTLLFALFGLVVLGAGGVVGFLVSQRANQSAEKSEPAPAAPQEDKHEMPVVEAGKAGESKAGESKAGESKAGGPESKAAETKAGEAKAAGESKASEAKAAGESKASESKAGESKATETKSDDTKPATKPVAADTKPATKPAAADTKPVAADTKTKPATKPAETKPAETKPAPIHRPKPAPPKPKPKPAPKPDQENQPWDPNSPQLPQ